jgi:hypothetical protein
MRHQGGGRQLPILQNFRHSAGLENFDRSIKEQYKSKQTAPNYHAFRDSGAERNRKHGDQHGDQQFLDVRLTSL